MDGLFHKVDTPAVCLTQNIPPPFRVRARTRGEDEEDTKEKDTKGEEKEGEEKEGKEKEGEKQVARSWFTACNFYFLFL